MFRLLACMAHPDDESLGMGAVLARYNAENIDTYLITATRGERGWTGSAEDNPGLQKLGEIRTAELHNAATILDIKEVNFLNYIDGDLDQADPQEATRKIVTHIRRIRPQVIVTFDPYGNYGHPDHIAISQLTTGAIVAAASDDYVDDDGLSAHRVQKLYFMAWPNSVNDIYESVFGELVMPIDGQERRSTSWPTWALTTEIDTAEYQTHVWEAIKCHRSQLPAYHLLENLTAEQKDQLWGSYTFYRAFSLVNGGRQKETDLFAGLRP